MRSSVFVSTFLHAIVITLGVYGLPAIRSAPILEDIPMVVEIVPMALRSNLPSVTKSEKPITKKVETKKSKNSPSPKVKKTVVPPLAPEKKKNAVTTPPIQKPILKPKMKKKFKVQKKVHKNLAKARPSPKPPPPDRFAMVLKNLEKDLAKTTPIKKPTKQKNIEPKSDIIARLSKTLSKENREFNPNRQISMSQRHSMINLIKRTMEPCWNFQAGSKRAQDIIVEIEVALRADGHVLNARITNQSQLNTDPFKQAAGESALRAVLNPSCQPYKLPINLYSEWKDLKLRFNPKEMLGR